MMTCKFAIDCRRLVQNTLFKTLKPPISLCHLPRKEISSCSLIRNAYVKVPNDLFRRNSQIYATNFIKFSTDKNEQEKKPSLYQRFKLMYKEYWYVLLPVHIATSACWLGGFYYMAISGVDICALLDMIGAPESWVTTMRESKAGGIVTAYTLYKIATPARYTVTLGGTTLSINYLKKWGLIKPMPSPKELKVIYEDKKAAIKGKVTLTKEEICDEFAKTKNEITCHMKEAKTGFKQSVTETKEGFKEGVREAAEEWKHVGRLVKRNVKEMVKKKEEPFK